MSLLSMSLLYSLDLVCLTLCLSDSSFHTTNSVLLHLSVEECRNIIMQFGVREVTAAQVARVLGMMARTHSGLTDGIPLQVSNCCGD